MITESEASPPVRPTLVMLTGPDPVLLMVKVFAALEIPGD
jgi:hypothetical protein